MIEKFFGPARSPPPAARTGPPASPQGVKKASGGLKMAVPVKKTKTETKKKKAPADPLEKTVTKAPKQKKRKSYFKTVGKAQRKTVMKGVLAFGFKPGLIKLHMLPEHSTSSIRMYLESHCPGFAEKQSELTVSLAKQWRSDMRALEAQIRESKARAAAQATLDMPTVMNRLRTIQAMYTGAMRPDLPLEDEIRELCIEKHEDTGVNLEYIVSVFGGRMCQQALQRSSAKPDPRMTGVRCDVSTIDALEESEKDTHAVVVRPSKKRKDVKSVHTFIFEDWDIEEVEDGTLYHASSGLPFKFTVRIGRTEGMSFAHDDFTRKRTELMDQSIIEVAQKLHSEQNRISWQAVCGLTGLGYMHSTTCRDVLAGRAVGPPGLTPAYVTLLKSFAEHIEHLPSRVARLINDDVLQSAFELLLVTSVKPSIEACLGTDPQNTQVQCGGCHELVDVFLQSLSLEREYQQMELLNAANQLRASGDIKSLCPVRFGMALLSCTHNLLTTGAPNCYFLCGRAEKGTACINQCRSHVSEEERRLFLRNILVDPPAASPSRTAVEIAAAVPGRSHLAPGVLAEGGIEAGSDGDEGVEEGVGGGDAMGGEETEVEEDNDEEMAEGGGGLLDQPGDFEPHSFFGAEEREEAKRYSTPPPGGQMDEAEEEFD